MNNNGNFELITENNLIVFSSNTPGHFSAYVEIQPDGKFTVKQFGNVLYEPQNVMIQYPCGMFYFKLFKHST
jgi:hypothetical protein